MLAGERWFSRISSSLIITIIDHHTLQNKVLQIVRFGHCTLSKKIEHFIHFRIYIASILAKTTTYQRRRRFPSILMKKWSPRLPHWLGYLEMKRRKRRKIRSNMTLRIPSVRRINLWRYTPLVAVMLVSTRSGIRIL